MLRLMMAKKEEDPVQMKAEEIKEPDWLDEVRESLKAGGELWVGRSAKLNEVVINFPKMDTDSDGIGHMVFSPNQARQLAGLLLKNADLCENLGHDHG